MPSRERAQAEIAAGRVLVGGAPSTKASRLVDPAEALMILGPPPPFVGRAGRKLAGAIERFDLGASFVGARVLDAGASTGGFTDCALQHGAERVIAVDVGHNQLHERLRADPRVLVLERTDIRTLGPDRIGGPVDLAVADLSFISLRLVLGPLLALCRPGVPLVLLVKPQFEAGRVEASRGRGIITDPQIWARVLEEVTSALDQLGAAIMGVMVSPITGTDGNVEFVLHACAPGAPSDAVGALWAEARSAAIAAAIAEAAGTDARPSGD